ncbi:hypothetical protein KR222_011380 [Zaprionus bogoriensis]|nr:hypothetical protein KR222_011380 [Zaprionus bogoriensis]
MIAVPLRQPKSSNSTSSEAADPSQPYELTNKGYGKESVKLMHINRQGPYHTIQEFEISTHMKLKGNREYLSGDNYDIIDSDAIRNMIFLLAKNHGIEGPEKFAVFVAKTLLEKYAHLEETSVHVETYPWQRIRQEKGDASGGKSSENYQLHNHAFVFTPTALHYCDVILKRQDSKPTVISGFKGLRVLKTTKSSFINFIQDEYVTTPQLYDRILSTIAEGSWQYSDITNVDFSKVWEQVTNIVQQTFAGDATEGSLSTSTQRTVYLCEKKVLDEVPQVAVIAMTLPNKHYYNFDTKPFQQIAPGENNDVFQPADKPYGIVYAQLTRKEISSHI